MSEPAVYRWPCGCSLPVAGPPPREGALPLLDLAADRNDHGCPAVWALLATGRTKGVFQLESSMARDWTKKLRPTADEHVGALGAILRPGCLAVLDENGVSVTEKYCLRKNGLEEAVAKHPALEGPLRATFMLMLYQEQMMKIAGEVAGFTKAKQGTLRKAGAKKDQSLMQRIGLEFVEAAEKVGKVTRAEAEAIFDDIRKSARYSFNKSHAISYGLTGIDTAWFKAHLPVAFFAGWLMHAKGDSDPRQEMFELAADARAFNVPVEPPDARDLSAAVSTDGVAVRFGLADVREAGPGQVDLMRAAVEAGEAALGKPRSGWGWPEWLVHGLSAVKSNVARAWVGAGAFRFTGVPRARQEKEYAAYAALTKREVAWAGPEFIRRGSLAAALAAYAEVPRKEGGPNDVNRRQAARDASILLANSEPADVDHPNTVAGLEEYLLGVALTCQRVDGCDRAMANWTCRQFNDGKAPSAKKMVLAVEVKEVRAKKTKKGPMMAWLSVDDGTDWIGDVVVFTEAYAEFKGLLYAGNCVLLEGRRDKNRGQFVVDRVYQLNDRLPGGQE